MPRGLVLWTPDRLRWLQLQYLQKRRPPSEILHELNAKFGTSYRLDQLYKAIEGRGWSKKKKEIERRIRESGEEVKLSAGSLAGRTVQQHQNEMARFVEESAKGAAKAFKFVQAATTSRELASAATAAKTLVTTYRLCAGLDAAESRNGGNTFNFNFASGFPPEPKPVEQNQEETEI